MSESIFKFKNYKTYLKKKANNERGLLTRLAEAANCELSYLSRSLSTEVNITSDQAYKMSVYLRLTPLERNFFLSLVEYERAGDNSYRNYLKIRLDEIIKEYEDLSNHTQKAKLENTFGLFSYHANWLHSAIHILVSIPQYQSLNSICQKLQINKDTALKIIEDLLAMNFISKVSENKYDYLQGGTHTSKDSPLVVLFHQNWRHRAIINTQNTKTDGVHYTNLQSMSSDDFFKIKDLIIELIEKNEKIAAPSKPEELVNLNIDFFKL